MRTRATVGAMLGAMLLLIGGVGGVDAVPTDDAYVAGYPDRPTHTRHFDVPIHAKCRLGSVAPVYCPDRAAAGWCNRVPPVPRSR